MLEKTHFAYAGGADRCALVTGAETVAIWHFSIDDPGDRDEVPPNIEIETSRSRIEGVAFVGPDRLLTIHQLGECVLWELPGIEEAQVPARTDEVDADADDDGDGDDELPAETQTSAPESGPDADEFWTGDLGLEICAFTARNSDEGFARSAAAGARTGEIVLFHLSGESPTVALADGHETDVTRLNFDPHGYRIASGGRDRRVMLWSTDDETFEPLASPETADASEAADSPDASESADSPDTPDTSEAADTSDSPESSDAPSSTAKRDAARRLASYELRCLNVLEGSQGWPLAIAFSHDEQRMATTALDNALYLWDPAADDPLLGVVSRHDNWVTEVAFSPDDTRVATGSWDSTIQLVDSQSLSPEFKFDIHTDFVSGLSFIPNSDRLVSTSYDGRLVVWNWRDGELVHEIEAHADWIEVLELVDDHRVFTVSSEDVIRLWDVETGEQLAELGDASFEGFQLGRAVDFSSYVDVPELASDELGEGREPVAALEAVERFDDQNRLDAGGGAEQTAVGLLENAIDDQALSSSDGRLEQRADSAGEDGTAMLESQLDDSGGEAERDPASETATDNSSRADEFGDEIEQVDAAFAEISDVEAENQKEQQDAEPTDDEDDLLNDRDLQSSVDNVGDAIDNRVEEESLGVSADLDEPENDVDPNADGGEPLEEGSDSDETDGISLPSPNAKSEGLDSGASPQLGGPIEDTDGTDEEGSGASEESVEEGSRSDAGAGSASTGPESTLMGTPEQHTSERAETDSESTGHEGDDDESKSSDPSN